MTLCDDLYDPHEAPRRSLKKQAERFNDQSLGEEIFNSVSHGIGALLSIAGTVVLIVMTASHGNAVGVVSSCLYGASLIFLYLMSTLYHALTHKGAKKVFQILDHCSIFVLILGCYIPICLSLIGGALGWALFGFNAALAVLGIVFNAVNLKRWRRLSLLLYLLMGWSVVAALGPMRALVPPSGFAFLVAGGLCYTIGVLFYKARRPRFMHAVWHLFVLAGSTLHYFFTLFYITLR